MVWRRRRVGLQLRGSRGGRDGGAAEETARKEQRGRRRALSARAPLIVASALIASCSS
jgi:hypothetical protein